MICLVLSQWLSSDRLRCLNLSEGNVTYFTKILLERILARHRGPDVQRSSALRLGT